MLFLNSSYQREAWWFTAALHREEQMPTAEGPSSVWHCTGTGLFHISARGQVLGVMWFRGTVKPVFSPSRFWSQT